MTNTELKLLRKYLFLDVVDAANYIADVSARTWQRYESGEIKIPKDVIDKMIELKQERNEILRSLNFNSDDPLKQKLIDSVKAELLSKSNLS